MTDVLSRQAFEQSCLAVGATNGVAIAELHAQLLAAWSEPQRFYHSLQHLRECLGAAREQASALSAAEKGELELALWFHDAVYDVKGKDNEERSAAWAQDALLSLAIPANHVAQVVGLVLATRHLGALDVPRSVLNDLMLDIDLAILGAEPQRYAEYDRQIAQEYSWVPSDQYRAGRSAVLQGFHQKAQAGLLFRTEWAKTELAPKALANLSRPE